MTVEITPPIRINERVVISVTAVENLRREEKRKEGDSGFVLIHPKCLANSMVVDSLCRYPIILGCGDMQLTIAERTAESQCRKIHSSCLAFREWSRLIYFQKLFHSPIFCRNGTLRPPLSHQVIGRHASGRTVTFTGCKLYEFRRMDKSGYAGSKDCRPWFPRP